jgi:hypothetical protein
MFCPQCKAEYRQGFTRCADCDVELVYASPHDSEQQAADERGGEFAGEDRDRKLIWKGNDESECVALCRLLMKADIPYKVAQVPVEAKFKMRVKWRYEISVPYTDSQLAKNLLGIEGEFADACYDPDDENETEEGNDVDELPVHDTPPDALVKSDSYLKHWYPEDATVEIWSQDGDDISGGVAMALKENLIHCRVDHNDGLCKAFVMPEDEARAREIVREVVEGLPD